MSSDNKSIVFILDSYPVDSQAFITNQIVGVLKAGYQVKIAVNTLNKIKESSQESIIRDNNILDFVTITNVKSTNNKFNKRLALLVLMIKNISLLKAFLIILKSNSIDKLRLCYKLTGYKSLLKEELFHVQFANNGFFIAKLKALGLLKEKAKIVTTFHGYDAHTTSKDIEERKKQLIPIFKYSNHIIVNSNYLKNQVLNLGCPIQKIMRIGVAYNSDEFKFNKNKIEGKIKLISIGRLIELKGHVYGLKVMQKLLALGVDVDYTIIGDGQEKENLETVINNYKLNKNVHLLGSKSQKEISNQLSKSDIFLMTSITDRNKRCETFGVVSVEAQAVGVPVVAFNSGGVSTTIKNGISGFLVAEKDCDAMVEAVLKLINDKDMLNTMSINASRFAKKKFSLEKVVEEHIKIYKL